MIVRRNADDPEACANCGEKIGKLETPHLWNDHIVCAGCALKLAPVLLSQTAAPNRGEIVCPNPNCNYMGKPTQKSRGIVAFVILIFSGLLALALVVGNSDYHEEEGELLFAFSFVFLIVGLLVAFVAGNIKKCPRCGIKINT